MKKAALFIYAGLAIVALSLFLELFYQFDPYQLLRWGGILLMGIGAWLHSRQPAAYQPASRKAMYISTGIGAIMVLSYLCIRFD